MSQRTKPYRILMLLENSSFPDDKRVLREAETLVGAGFEVMVICPTGESRKWTERVGGIQVYRYPETYEFGGLLGYTWEYGYSLTMHFLISVFVFLRRGFDAVHVHTPPDMTGVIAIFYQWLGKKFVFDLHDLSPELYLAKRQNTQPNVVYRALRFFERLSCGNADRLIATNATQRAVQIDRCGANPDHCYVVRNGPSESMLRDIESKSELRQPGRLVLGYVGAIGTQDGVDYMIRIIHELKFRHHRDDFIAVIVGEGPALAGLKLLAEELDVTELIEFMGLIPFCDVAAYIASFDICLTPDPSNAYNDSCTTIKTMEYMALRKPTVCFRTHENQLTAGEAALYADNNNVSLFADAVVQLMDDPALRQALGQIGRNRIENGLTWNHQSAALLALYNDLFGLSEHASISRVSHDPYTNGSTKGRPTATV